MLGLVMRPPGGREGCMASCNPSVMTQRHDVMMTDGVMHHDE